jgi:hypothetical protein
VLLIEGIIILKYNGGIKTMISVTYANKVLKDFIAENGKDLLPIEINNILERNAKNDYPFKVVEKLTLRDRIIASMRYSEFLTDGSTNEEYYNADIFAQKLRTKHNIDFTWLMAECEKLCCY